MEARRITVEELKRKMDAGEPLFILDVRGLSWDESNEQIPGSHRIRLSQLADRSREIPTDHEVVAY